MSRIESLSPTQKARFAEFRDEWIAIGLSTEPAQRGRAESAVKVMYQKAGLAAPQKIIWCGSPFSQGLTRAVILDETLGASVWASVRDSVGASVRASVRASVGDSGYGSHDASWLGFYAFFREVCNLRRETEVLTGHLEQAKSAGWYLPYKNICWVSERHHVLRRDNRGHLHCLTGPAVMYPDGWAVYAVHGVRVPEYVIEHPNDITVQKIGEEGNVEIRRVMIERYGEGRYLEDSGAKVIHADEYGTLYRKEVLGDEPLVMVKVVNATPEPDGSQRRFFLRVPPDMTKAKEAVAWTFGLKEKEYCPNMET